MAYELWNVLGVAALALVLIVLQTLVAFAEYGLPTLAGPRDATPAPSGKLLGRLSRTIGNLQEGMLIFLPLVFIAFSADRFGPASEFGTALFLWSRVAHAVFYALGAPYLRTLAWTGGVVGCGFVAAAIIG